MDHATISNEQLIELLIMADRFEVEQLSTGCQTILASRLDNSNVLCLLAVADQWSATQLQVKFYFAIFRANQVRLFVVFDFRNLVSATFGNMEKR